MRAFLFHVKRDLACGNELSSIAETDPPHPRKDPVAALTKPAIGANFSAFIIHHDVIEKSINGLT